MSLTGTSFKTESLENSAAVVPTTVGVGTGGGGTSLSSSSLPIKPSFNILQEVYQTWYTDAKGRLIIGCWIGGLTIASLWGIYTRRKMKARIRKEHTTFRRITPQAPSSSSSEAGGGGAASSSAHDNKEDEDTNTNDIGEPSSPRRDLNGSNFKRSLSYANRKPLFAVIKLAMPGAISLPTFWSGLLVMALVWKTRSQSSVNDSIGALGEIVVSRKWHLLARATMEFAIISVRSALALATVDYLQRLLTSSVRYYLTHRLQKKYRIKGILESETSGNDNNKPNSARSRHGGQHILHMVSQIPDADARMTKDIEQWSEHFSLCLVNFTKPIIDISVYSTKLVHGIGMFQFGQCIFYFFISGLWTRMALPSASMTRQLIASKEAMFASHHHRVVEYVEEIHYLKGIDTEITLLNESYEQLSTVLNNMSYLEYISNFLNNYVVRYLGILASFVSLLPMLEHESHPTEFLLNSLHDLVNLGLAFRDVMKSHRDFQSLVGLSARIMELNEHLEKQLKEISIHAKNASVSSIFYDQPEEEEEEEEEDKQQQVQGQKQEKQEEEQKKLNQNEKQAERVDGISSGRKLYKKKDEKKSHTNEDDEDLQEDVSEMDTDSEDEKDLEKKDASQDQDQSSKRKSKKKSWTTIEKRQSIKNEKLTLRIGISFVHVTIYTPDQSQLLVQDLNLKIKLGENIMIKGRNGSGKSSILRVLSGIWKVSDGKIRISPLLHSGNDMYFLPQRAYLIPELSIRQQLLYPDIQTTNTDSSDVDKDNNNNNLLRNNSMNRNGLNNNRNSSVIERKSPGEQVSNEEITELLNCCDLGRLPLYYDINAPLDSMFWHQLSPGEQQLIGLCRVLLRRPKIAFLDECCSAVSEDKKHWFYQACSKREITVVSIAHDSALEKYHDCILQLKGDGTGQYTITYN